MKDGISFIENEKRPRIDLRGWWGGAGELRDCSDSAGAFKKNVVACLPFPHTPEHIELCGGGCSPRCHCSCFSTTSASVSYPAPIPARARNALSGVFCRCSKILIKVCVFEEESESKVRPGGLFSLPLLSDLESNRVIRGNMPPVCLLLGIDTSLAEIVGFR